MRLKRCNGTNVQSQTLLRMCAVVYCVFSFCVADVGQQISDCEFFRSCQSSALPNGGGTRVDYSYAICGGWGVGGGFSGCLNNTPGATCPSHDCESRCDGTFGISGFTHTYYDCNDVLHIDTSQCSGCPYYCHDNLTYCEQDETCCSYYCNLDNYQCWDVNYNGGCTNNSDCLEGQYCDCPPSGPPCNGHGTCEKTPILIDVAGDGFQMTDAADGVLFDFIGSGIPRQISWTASDSDDAWLVLDRNRNERIENGKELFGNITPQPIPASGKRDGFLALALYDSPNHGGNADVLIDQNDSIFSHLRLWQDRNHNGVSEAEELHALSELGVEAISLDYKESRRRDRWGNVFRYRAKVYGPNHSDLGRWAYDVVLLSARDSIGQVANLQSSGIERRVSEMSMFRIFDHIGSNH